MVMGKGYKASYSEHSKMCGSSKTLSFHLLGVAVVPTASEVIWVLGHSLAEWEMVREPAQAGELQGLHRVLMGHNGGCLIGSWVCGVCPRDELPFLAAWRFQTALLPPHNVLHMVTLGGSP